MYFPADMNFQYFFFSTYPGYFLQALPFALLAGILYGMLRYRKDQTTPFIQKVCDCALVCYLTGLVCLVVGLDLMGEFWYRILYHRDSGIHFRWFGGDFYFIPDFFHHISSEVIGNFLMVMPFGLLYPLSRKERTWKCTLGAGFLLILVIELLQPIFGRAFDINDLILNMLGISVSSAFFFLLKPLFRHK